MELERAVKVKPDYAEAYYTLGTVYRQMGKLPLASEALQAAIRLQPDFAGAHTTLAAIFRQQGNEQAAAEENRLANHIRETQMGLQAAQFATNSGLKLLNAGDFAGAISQFDRAIKTYPDYLPAHQQLAVALERNGDLKRAAEERAIAAKLSSKTGN